MTDALRIVLNAAAKHAEETEERSHTDSSIEYTERIHAAVASIEDSPPPPQSADVGIQDQLDRLKARKAEDALQRLDREIAGEQAHDRERRDA